MGQWLARLLQKEGHEVILADRNQEDLLALQDELKVGHSGQHGSG